VKNASPTEVILEALNDSVYGPLEEADGGCSLPRTLEPDVTYTCTLRVEVTGTVGVHEDVVIASGTDQNKNPVSDSARAQVTIVRLPPEAGMGTPAAIVAGGMAAGGLVLLLAGTLLRRRTT
jgi:hypothetical protein